ncbi:cytochrome c oxidase assembly protein [Kribbella antibiotica]|uniref:Cytochrome c oxidase assembly protein n=1 Tax=Kribbella antibiotica TaxID=190195 RepID=A0A4R4ZVG0_9ACTN|nr:cytochrome c oxidase assembly protein [Kribbella antibiotica]
MSLADPTAPPVTPPEGHHGHGHAHTGVPVQQSFGDVAGWSDLATWRPSLGWLLFIAVLAGGYFLAVLALRQRQVRWPIGRTIAWYAGLLGLLAITCTGLAELGMMLFSIHMIQHMLLSMIVPIGLILGAPITLALRALPAAPGRSGMARRILLAVLHSRLVRVIAHPIVTVTLFVVSLYALYFTSLLDKAMATHVGHQLMLIHFLAIGILFFGPILAVDPWPHRASPGIRLAELLAAVPFHAFFGVILMQTTTPLSPRFAEMTRQLGLDPSTDQLLGGSIAWGSGELPVVIVTAVVFRQWIVTDARAAKRLDRQADRDNDAELTAYNAYLDRLRQHASRG